MIGQQRPQRSTLPDRSALKILALPKLRELPVRCANLRTLEIIQIEIGQQMEPRLDFDNVNRRAAIVSDERFGPRHHQQIEGIVIRPALTRCELGRLRRSPPPQRVEAEQTARSRLRIASVLRRPPIQQAGNNSVLTNSEPGPSRSEILPANNMGMLQQGSRIPRRPFKKLIAISRNHNRTIARSPKINRQRAHPYKIGSPQPPRTTPVDTKVQGLPGRRKSETHGGFYYD